MNATPRTFDVSSFFNDRKLSSFNYLLIILSWLITVFDGLDMSMISYTAPYIQDDLGLSKSHLSEIFSAGVAGAALGGFLFSYIGDRIGRRPAVVIAAYAFGILTCATALAGSYEQLLALRFLDGLAIGGMLPLAWSLNIEFVPKKMRSTVVTSIMIGYSAGAAAAGPMTNWIAPHYQWHGVFVAGGVATLICAIVLHVALPESVRFLVTRERNPELVAKTLKRMDPQLDVSATDNFILSDEKKAGGRFSVGMLFHGDLKFITPLIWLGYGISSLAIFFITSWGPLLLEALEFPRQTAALISSLNSFLGACMGLALMRFTDHHGPKAVAVFPAIVVPILILLGLGYVPQPIFLVAFTLGMILVTGGHFGIQSICGIYYPSAIRASGAGWASSIAKFGGTLGPLVGGAILASGWPVQTIFAFLAVCPAILVLSVLGIARVVRARDAIPQSDAIPQGGEVPQPTGGSNESTA
jgi:MFS transporter, AAHS family, 4-hydroxybenzoate transporter